MGYEIDFLAVGEESKGGDAISLRWGELYSNKQFIVVIDGGFSDSGEELVKSINKHYGDPDTIDLVVSTHPDADHINGLSYVLDKFKVKKLWLHKPWEHNYDIASKFKDGRVTDDSIGKRLKEACEAAYDLWEKARDKGILVEEPFSCKNMTISSHGGQLKILGPSEKYYEELLPEFDGLPEATDSPRSEFAHAAQRTVNWVKEFFNRDSIDDNGETSAKNNSSVILELSYDSKRLIFTGDAGIPALGQAVNKTGYDELRFIQIPHHGSRRNVGPTVLNDLVGNIAPRNENKSISAYVSCPKENPKKKHPNKRVLNAFTRRRCNCFTTAGRSLCHSDKAPNRGWSKVDPCEFYDEVEDDS